MPTRRSLLAALSAVSLLPSSGCLSAPVVDGGLPGGGSDSGNTRPSGTGGPGVTLAGVDNQPDGPLEIDVAITEAVATEEHPPGLRVSVTNTGDEPVTIGEARAVVFAYQYSTANSLLMLLPAEGDYPAEPGCWRLTDGIAVTQEYATRTLAAGETISAALRLYATTEVEADACLPVGEYRFESQYSLNPEGANQGFSWGFSVLLE